jgi:hypothetical protein
MVTLAGTSSRMVPKLFGSLCILHRIHHLLLEFQKGRNLQGPRPRIRNKVPFLKGNIFPRIHRNPSPRFWSIVLSSKCKTEDNEVRKPLSSPSLSLEHQGYSSRQLLAENHRGTRADTTNFSFLPFTNTHLVGSRYFSKDILTLCNQSRMTRRFHNYRKKYSRVNFNKCEMILKPFNALTRPSNSIIHILTKVDIPPEVIIFLNLGLKFSFSLKINWDLRKIQVKTLKPNLHQEQIDCDLILVGKPFSNLT